MLRRASLLSLALLALGIAGGSCVRDEAQLMPGGPGAPCPDGLSRCGAACVDTELDPAHCGACDAPCVAGELCSAGQCGLDCVGGTTECADRCVDTMVDPSHCGECDVACGSEAACSAGECRLLCGSEPCAPGQHLWSRRFGNTLNNYFHGIEQDTEGNIYLAGHFEGSFDLGGGAIGGATAYSVVVAKLRPDGSHLWSKAFGNTDGRGYAVAVDPAGNVLLSGIFRGTIDFGNGPLTAASATAWDGFLAKLDSAGNAVWSKRFGDATDTRVHYVEVDAEGNAVITGIFSGTIDLGDGLRASAGSWDGYVAKFGPLGNLLWVRTFGDADDQRALGLALGPGGEVYLSAQFRGSMDLGGGPLTSAGDWDGYLVKLDAGGNELWAKSFGSADPEQHLTVCSTDDEGNVFVGGQFQGSWDFGGGTLTSAGASDALVAKFDGSGNHVFSKSFGDPSDQVTWAVAADDQGGVMVNGYFQGVMDVGGTMLQSAGSWDHFVARLDGSGQTLWAQGFGDDVHQVGQALSLGPSGKIVTTGYFQGAVDFGGGALATAGADDCWLTAFAP